MDELDFYKLFREVHDEVLLEIARDELEWSQTVRVGDYVDSMGDGHSASGANYRTKDKLYKVKLLNMTSASRTIIADSDIAGEVLYLGPGRVIVRDGKIIWRNSTEKAVIDLQKKYTSDQLTKAKLILFEPDLSNLE